MSAGKILLGLALVGTVGFFTVKMFHKPDEKKKDTDTGTDEEIPTDDQDQGQSMTDSGSDDSGGGGGGGGNGSNSGGDRIQPEISVHTMPIYNPKVISLNQTAVKGKDVATLGPSIGITTAPQTGGGRSSNTSTPKPKTQYTKAPVRKTGSRSADGWANASGDWGMDWQN